MPQLDLFTFSSQIFWFIVIFWALYLVLFSTFIFPFAFIIKARSYLSMSFIGNTPNTKVEWEGDNLKIFLDIITSISYLENSLTNNHSIDVSSLHTLTESSFDSIHAETDFSAFISFVVLTSVKVEL